MVRVRITQPSLRAVIADSPRSKKIQIWPPFPERERSRAAGTLKSRHVSRNARESYSHVLLSKSAARKRHVSSERRGYKPTVSLPKRWFSITASVSGMNFRVFLSTFFRSSGRVYLNSFGRRRILWRKLRNRNAVNRQEPPQASVLLAKTNVLLLRRFEWKRVWTILAHGAFTASCEVPALLRNTSARPQTPQ